MDRVCFSRQLFLDFFGQVQRGIGAGEQEYLFFFAQRGQELDGFFLALFVEADEDVVEDERHRFDLFGEGHGQADADGQVNLVAQAAAPLFSGTRRWLPSTAKSCLPSRLACRV